MEDIKGFQFADGVHWQYKGKDVAVINGRGEIEWCERIFTIPDEVVDEIRKCRPKPSGKWVIEVFKEDLSVTQGYYRVTINGDTVATWGADKKLTNHRWEFDIPDEELGRLVYSTFWHRLDDYYHYSDKAKDIFKPNWRNK